MAVEEIVAEDEGGGLVFEEADIGGDVEGLGEAVGAGLFGVGKGDAKLRAVAEESAEEGQVGGRRDDEDFPDAGEHQHGQRVVDHRLVVDGHELFGDSDGERVEPGAGAAGEDDAFTFHEGVGDERMDKCERGTGRARGA